MAGSKHAGPAKFFLTRYAALELRNIHTRSLREWGAEVAERYLAELYAVMHKAAAHPEMGELRQHRSAPFLMVPARQHFVIYDKTPEGIVVLTIQHQARNIETLIAEFSPSFYAEVERLKRR
jgi:plasmid stabilization system protein ParE